MFGGLELFGGPPRFWVIETQGKRCESEEDTFINFPIAHACMNVLLCNGANQKSIPLSQLCEKVLHKIRAFSLGFLHSKNPRHWDVGD